MKTHLYPAQINFDTEFKNPSSVFRDAPFWAWNGALEQAELDRQLDIFKIMGMGGAHMHVRSGLETPYMTKEFLDLVKGCVKKSQANGLYAYLYDEDRWPSGSAGGQVTQNPQFRARHLLITEKPRQINSGSAEGVQKLLYTCFVQLDADGYMTCYGQLDADANAPAGARRLYCYLEIERPSGWQNNQTYVNTLDPEAIKCFIAKTHERYAKAIGKDFGKTVPSIFTDEPQFWKRVKKFAQSDEEVFLAYFDELPETYLATYHEPFFDRLPEIIFDRADRQYSLARYRYHDFIAERFAASFADQIGQWCDQHNLLLTGHMMEEPTLESQTHSLGDAMRSYRSFGLPGIDMLCDWHEYSTAKQAQSASRQFGCGGVLSELDGVTGWDFTFMDHKGHGDWQAALGVTLRVPHLAWVCMQGEAKRDYPASINYQSPFFSKYSLIANHFARVGTAMTRGNARCRVGVIHPIESYWLAYGPQDLTADTRRQMQDDFDQLLHYLLFGLVDFDYIAESLLEQQIRRNADGSYNIGEMRYDTIIVPPVTTLRKTTVDFLTEFSKTGSVASFGKIACLDAQNWPGSEAFLNKYTTRLQFNRSEVLHFVEKHRDLTVLGADGYPVDCLLYQMREDGDTRYCFIANTKRRAQTMSCRVKFKGSWQVDLLDTMTGAITQIAADNANGWTSFAYDFTAHGHLLVRLTPGAQSVGMPLTFLPHEHQALEDLTVARLGTEGPLAISLDEPNVLLLDHPEYRLDSDKKYREADEVLRVGNLIRQALGIPENYGGDVQPYIERANPHGKEVLTRLKLRYTVNTAVAVDAPLLALEQPERTDIDIDGAPLAKKYVGYWTDETIQCVRLPRLTPGKHQIELSYDYRKGDEPEACYLLGDFGVKLSGRQAMLVEPVNQLGWGDAAQQGLPFYGGNLTYHVDFVQKEAQELQFMVPSQVSYWQVPDYFEVPFVGYAGSLLEVSLDGLPPVPVAFAPFAADLGLVQPGKHRLDVTLYGSRRNAFGPQHLPFRPLWTGPGEWRGRGNYFDYTYSIVKFGVFLEPRLLKKA